MAPILSRNLLATQHMVAARPLGEDRRDDGGVTHAVLATITAFLNTEGADLLIGVVDDGSVVGIEVEHGARAVDRTLQVYRDQPIPERPGRSSWAGRPSAS